MALRGTLGDFSLTDILQLIGLQRKSGSLILEREDQRVVIGFDNGRVVAAESSTRTAEHRLGSLLVKVGRLTEARLDEALRIQKETLRRLGHVLVEQGWVDPEAIRRQLELQMTETVFDTLRWRSGDYDFRPDRLVEWDREFINPIPAEHLLMEGARMIDEWPMIERVLPSREVVLRQTAEAAQMLASAGQSPEAEGSIYEQDIDFGLIPRDPLGEADKSQTPRLSAGEHAVLRWVDGQRPASEVADLSELGSFEAFKTMARLVELNLLEPVPEHRERVSRRTPRLMGSEAVARLAGVVLALLVVLGAASALQVLWRAVSPGNAPLALPGTAAPSSWLAETAGLDRLRTTISSARLNRLEQALRLYYLDRGTWPSRLEQLVQRELIPRSLIVDPWGRPYRYEVSPTGYRVAERASTSDRPPQARERDFRRWERPEPARGSPSAPSSARGALNGRLTGA
ncbi:MAG: DUF4388 domain-containing protein [Acidobacteriota bacterium]|nr:MAG: DUF4388 domain-containing protein [Acidobacteriota bacterium]